MHLLKFSPSRLAINSLRNRQELIAEGLTSRRDLMRLGLLSSAGVLIAKHGLSSRVANAGDVQSPRTRAFVEPLPIPAVKRPLLAGLAGLSPYPTVEPNNAGGEGRTRAHQAFTDHASVFQFGNIQKVFETVMKAAPTVVSPDLPVQDLWGFDGLVPGPTYHAKYGEQMLVRNRLQLPSENGGFGKQRVSTHLHNGHTPSESDGFPHDFYPNPYNPLTANATFYDHHYPNALAGFSTPEFAAVGGDLRESLSTLWYHDHMVHYTAQNTYKGLSGFYLLFNHLDTGDETTGFRLPGVRNPYDFYANIEYDVPLMICDRVFDPSTGKLYFDMFEKDGILGDRFLVNGKIQPYFEVKARRYRFRILSGGPSRFYHLFLTDKTTNTSIPFWQIASDGNLLPRPIKTNNVPMSVAERVDIVIDFKQWAGKTLYLENRLIQTDGRGPEADRYSPLSLKPPGQGDLLMQFRVGTQAVEDNSVDFETNPNVQFYPLPEIAAPRVSRNFRLKRFNGTWQINDKLFPEEEGQVHFRVKRNSAEHWTWQNNSGGWMHPMHMHFEEFQLMNRNGKKVQPGTLEHARKDVLWVGHGEACKVAYRFRDFQGRYPMHCHNTLHEDHAMMLRVDIDDVGDTNPKP
jgi:FtsP/CotA-like multicopper oxidase with cupredoxin domain